MCYIVAERLSPSYHKDFIFEKRKASSKYPKIKTYLNNPSSAAGLWYASLITCLNKTTETGKCRLSGASKVVTSKAGPQFPSVPN